MKRNGIIAALLSAGALLLVLTSATPETSKPSGKTIVNKNRLGFLEGTFVVRCRRGHNDVVEGITRNHDCEKDCPEKSVDEGTAYVVCPYGHPNRVEGITRSRTCAYPLQSGGICGQECRRH